MLHSHPNDRQEDNDNFSWGDGLVAALFGKIYLTTPGGELYALDRWNSRQVIPTGMAHDILVGQINTARRIKNRGEEHPWLRAAYLPLFKGAELYDHYLSDDVSKTYKWFDQFTEGSAYQTFDADTYNAKNEK